MDQKFEVDNDGAGSDDVDSDIDSLVLGIADGSKKAFNMLVCQYKTLVEHLEWKNTMVDRIVATIQIVSKLASESTTESIIRLESNFKSKLALLYNNLAYYLKQDETVMVNGSLKTRKELLVDAIQFDNQHDAAYHNLHHLVEWEDDGTLPTRTDRTGRRSCDAYKRAFSFALVFCTKCKRDTYRCIVQDGTCWPSYTCVDCNSPHNGNVMNGDDGGDDGAEGQHSHAEKVEKVEKGSSLYQIDQCFNKHVYFSYPATCIATKEMVYAVYTHDLSLEVIRQLDRQFFIWTPVKGRVPVIVRDFEKTSPELKRCDKLNDWSCFSGEQCRKVQEAVSSCSSLMKKHPNIFQYSAEHLATRRKWRMATQHRTCY